MTKKTGTQRTITQAMIYVPHNPELNYYSTIIVPTILHKDNIPLKRRTTIHTSPMY
jgi:hypothetical protein